MAGHSKKRYLGVFVFLIVLTLIELGVAQWLSKSRGMMITLLVGLALAKAAAVAMYYMHLADEKRGLKLIVGLPLLFPPLAVGVLMFEAIARMTGHK